MALPKLPDPDSVFSAIDKAGGVIDKGLGLIDKVSDRLDKIGLTEEPRAPGTPITAPESQEEPPLSQSEAVATGTACLPCCRDHLSTSSSALSEGIRFARDKGIKDPEALRRIRIALDELNVMERIDLAPDEIVRLKGAERELADWTLKGSQGNQACHHRYQGCGIHGAGSRQGKCHHRGVHKPVVGDS